MGPDDDDPRRNSLFLSASHRVGRRALAAARTEGATEDGLYTRRLVRVWAVLIAYVYDFGVAESGRVFYAMELLRGLTLEALVERGGPLPSERVIHLLDGVLGALDEAHHLGLVHRDVKPANIMVIKHGTEHDFPKLLDYGLVHVLRKSNESVALTQRGALAGTPLYMAPEQISDDAPPDGRTDVYALGAVGYFLLTGQAPFDGRTAAAVVSNHLTQKPVPPSQRCELPIPADVEAVIRWGRPAAATAAAAGARRCSRPAP